MQGTSTSPHAYIGAYSYDPKGQATWSVTNSKLHIPAVTAYPKTGAQKRWQLTAQLVTYSGTPFMAKPKAPLGTVTSTPVVATLTPLTPAPANNTVKFASNNPFPLVKFSSWGQPANPYWAQIVNKSPAIKAPYVTYFPESRAVLIYIS